MRLSRPSANCKTISGIHNPPPLEQPMRRAPREDCPHCAGTGWVRNLATLSPADDEPCECTDDADQDENN